MQAAVVTTEYTDLQLPAGYRYLEAGCALRGSHRDGILHDDAGENISAKNDTYCELTALYWLWKNGDRNEIRGLCHYRRFFEDTDALLMFPMEMTGQREAEKRILREERAEEYLKDHDIILRMPYEPGGRTVREDLLQYVYAKDIEILDDVMEGQFPAYAGAYREVMDSSNISYCNMFLAPGSVFDDYCSWLFDVLARYEQATDLRGYDRQHRRIYGYVGEVLLNVYVKRNGLRPKYLNALGVLEYFGRTREEKRQMELYEKAQRMCAHEAGRKLYALYFKRQYPLRYKNYLEMKEREAVYRA